MPQETPDPHDEPRRPSTIGRAHVRSASGREPVPPADPFEPEPVTGVARVGQPGDSRPPAGRHAAHGVLPSGLSIRKALRLRGRMLSTAFAVLLMLLGSGVVAGAAFLDSVQLSDELDFPETTTVFYSDGSVLSRLGEVTRYELPFERISPYVKDAIVASEDDSFWTNQGIDVAGVMRAAWNNFTGGATQGASTITQQYARIAYELGRESSYQRKLKEAVLAWKMGQSMSKEEILTGYLNSVSFGRQAYGVEAAARAFFKKSADTAAVPEQQLTLAEAIVLIALVKQPYPDPSDPVGLPGFDPSVSDAAAANARARFDYVAGQLMRTGVISAEERAALVFPEGAVLPYEPAQDNKMTHPEGHIVRQVLSELT
jgi:membrane peptidoglycan carboxypeptidase